MARACSSATRSDRFAIATLLLACAPAGAQAPSRAIDTALHATFPAATFERMEVRLSDADIERIARDAGSSPSGHLVFAYAARVEGAVVATVYFDAHRVRTKRQALMVAVDPRGRIHSVDTFAFAEPPEYRARATFLEQFRERALDDDLRIGRRIDGMTGATITSRTTVECARRVLAIQRIVSERATPPPPPPEPSPSPRPPIDGERKPAKGNGRGR